MLELIWDNTYGLLVDDGRMAAGAIIILVVIGGLNRLVESDPIHEISGYLFVGLVALLILTNLYAAGRNAARKKL